VRRSRRDVRQSQDVRRVRPEPRPACSPCAWDAWAAVRRETAPARMGRLAGAAYSCPARRLDVDRRSACRAQVPVRCPFRMSVQMFARMFDLLPASPAGQRMSTCRPDAARFAASRFCARVAAAPAGSAGLGELRELAQPEHRLRKRAAQPPPARHWLPRRPQSKTVQQLRLEAQLRSAASRLKRAAFPVPGVAPAVPHAQAVLRTPLPAAEPPLRWGARAWRLPVPLPPLSCWVAARQWPEPLAAQR